MNEIEKSTQAAEKVTEKENIFKGYTIEELRYQRALVTMQKEFCKAHLMRSVQKLQQSNPLTPSGAVKSLPGTVGKVASTLMSGLNYLDYAMIGFSVFGSLRKVFSFFKKKK